ncbi:MAG: PHP domain-containing protein [Clostridia bacterium]|nr:PHP domain-containing protein [Clostridia bacterium]
MQTAKDIKEQLKGQYPYRVELHAHTTPASKCGEATPEKLMEIYAGLGYHALVLTNHFGYQYGFFGDESLSKEEHLELYLKDYEDAVQAAKKYGINVLLGAELRFSQNHNDYMLYGADYDVLSTAYDYLEAGLETFRREVKLEHSLLIQAHPFRKGIEKVAPELLDGMETFNMHPGHNAAIGIAIRYAKEQGLSVTTAGSDFHHLNRGHEGVAALRTKVLPKDSFALAEILKQGDYVFELGSEAIVLP